MKRYSMVSLFAVLTVLLLVGQPRLAKADSLDLEAHWSGSLSRTGSDIVDDTGDGTGAKALISNLAQKGTLGQSTVVIVSELTTDLVGVFTANCPSLSKFVEFDFLAHSSVTRISSTGDLIFTLLDDGHLCLDPTTGAFDLSVDVFVVGGTGRFAGATGSGNASGSGNILLSDAGGSIAFGSLDGDTRMEIVLPDED